MNTSEISSTYKFERQKPKGDQRQRIERRYERYGRKCLTVSTLVDLIAVPSLHGHTRATKDGKEYAEIGPRESLPKGVFTLTKRAMSAREAEDSYYGDAEVMAAQASSCGPVVCTGYGQTYTTGGRTVRRAYLRPATREELAALPAVGERWGSLWDTSEEELSRIGLIITEERPTE